MPLFALAGAIGAALAYFFDPDNGRRRRKILSDKAGKYVRQTGQQAQGVGAQAQGLGLVDRMGGVETAKPAGVSGHRRASSLRLRGSSRTAKDAGATGAVRRPSRDRPA